MGEQTRTQGPPPAEPGPEAPGLTDGGSIVAGDTPPGEDSMSGAVGDLRGTPNHGPISGNRTPMIITLVFLGLIVLSLLGYGVAEIVGYLRRH